MNCKERGDSCLLVGILLSARKDGKKYYEVKVSQLPQFPSPVFHLRVEWQMHPQKFEEIRLKIV